MAEKLQFYNPYLLCRTFLLPGPSTEKLSFVSKTITPKIGHRWRYYRPDRFRLLCFWRVAARRDKTKRGLSVIEPKPSNQFSGSGSCISLAVCASSRLVGSLFRSSRGFLLLVSSQPRALSCISFQFFNFFLSFLCFFGKCFSYATSQLWLGSDSLLGASST